MLKVNKGNEPDFLARYKKKHSPKQWNDYDKDDIRNKIKGNILKLEQEEYCPYCEQRIHKNDDSHIEHIKPRDIYPKEFQNYSNLLVSCNEKNSCGKYKDNKYGECFINLVIDDPQDYFDYIIANGEITPRIKAEDSIEYKKAIYTINLLNLNSNELKNARANLIDMLSVYKDNNRECLQFFLEDGNNFPSIIKLCME
ncbi:retron system putative HNH endonuclease [Clostridium sp. FP1]|uniref:retron system putative HNH endonuclease n=1 Tax=Clostridium sp. FP1 TaxID=2724076 RepID=UPI0013E99D8C|nr:retron system putative HNH endonuclease [Clostridium sp. FP1]MBZ9633336.1 TIGR02646 family protein [Clostridium sp. FP1]